MSALYCALLPLWIWDQTAICCNVLWAYSLEGGNKYHMSVSACYAVIYMYIISHTTSICFVVVISSVLTRFMPFIYPYFSWLLPWHWGNHTNWQSIIWTSYDKGLWYGIISAQLNVILLTPSHNWSLCWRKTCCICTLLNYPNSPCLGFIVIIVWCWPFFSPKLGWFISHKSIKHWFYD